jgi:NADPH:quinone reductase-like Zn-dependent oxidoreductase
MRTEETKAITHIQTQDVVKDTSMKGKTVLFTGASRGIGRSAAIELARRGAKILVEETLGISAALRAETNTRHLHCAPTSPWSVT